MDWRDPRRWARAGRWLLVPVVVLDWFALVPQPVFVVAFVLAAVGLAAMAAALVSRMLRRGRLATGLAGLAMLLGGLVLFGTDPFPGAFPLIEPWWPDVLTEPQHVGSAYWQLLALGVELAGVGLLGTLLVVAVIGPPRRPAAPDHR